MRKNTRILPINLVFNIVLREKDTFINYDKNSKLVGFFSCGGCPGRRIFRLIRTLKEEVGLDVIHLVS
ncbi:MAG: CGGC domain-containing protein [Promethearchaeota archaeon]